MKIAGVRPLRDANGVELPRQNPALVASTARIDLIAAIKQIESIKNVKSCDNASIKIAEAIYGRRVDDVNGFVIEAKTVGGQRIIPDDGQLRRALAFFSSPADTAVFHFMVEPTIHHFVLIPWYDDTVLHGRAYTMLMAYSVLAPNGSINEHLSYSIRDYLQRTSGQMEPYKDVWTDDEMLGMLRDLFNSDTAWSRYFLAGTNAEVNKITVYKYENITIQRALKRLRGM